MDPRTKLNEQQIDAIFVETLKNEAPAQPKTIPLPVRLAPFRKKLIEYHLKGYSSEQLVRVLAHPQIGIAVSASFLRKYVAPSGKRVGRKTPPATGLPPVPATAPAS